MNEIITPVLAKLVRRTDIDGRRDRGRVRRDPRGARVRYRGRRVRGRAAHQGRDGHRARRDGAHDAALRDDDRRAPTARSTRAAPAAIARARSTCRRSRRSIAAGAGARVVKHGNRAASSQCGSADVLEALGIPVELGPAGVERCVAEVGLGFCLAQRYHPALRFMGPARRELGVPTTFNFLGPLANPARVRRQAVGVSDPDDGRTGGLRCWRRTEPQHAWVFHGDDGLDELTTTTTSTVYELRDGAVRRFTIDPSDLGYRAGREAATSRAATPPTNADAVRAVLDGKPGAVRDIALLNAAAALVVAGQRRRSRRRAGARARGRRQRRRGAGARRLAPASRPRPARPRRAECRPPCNVPIADIRRCSTTSARHRRFAAADAAAR